jgi:hypothetical protein
MKGLAEPPRVPEVLQRMQAAGGSPANPRRDPLSTPARAAMDVGQRGGSSPTASQTLSKPAGRPSSVGNPIGPQRATPVRDTGGSSGVSPSGAGAEANVSGSGNIPTCAGGRDVQGAVPHPPRQLPPQLPGTPTQQCQRDLGSQGDIGGSRSTAETHTCAACGGSPSERLRCGRCKGVWYCNRECQKAHWKHHKSTHG